MNQVEQINRCIAASAHHRDQLESLAREIVQLHGEAPGSCEADELMHVIFDGADYETAMNRVMRIKKHRNR